MQQPHEWRKLPEQAEQPDREMVDGLRVEAAQDLREHESIHHGKTIARSPRTSARRARRRTPSKSGPSAGPGTGLGRGLRQRHVRRRTDGQRGVEAQQPQ
ncbi:hypothetical protein GCM10027161_22950 [Microbispora hainanensis]